MILLKRLAKKVFVHKRAHWDLDKNSFEFKTTCGSIYCWKAEIAVGLREKPSKIRLFLIDAIQDLFIGLSLRYLVSI